MGLRDLSRNKNNEQLWGAYYVPRVVLSTSHTFFNSQNTPMN